MAIATNFNHDRYAIQESYERQKLEYRRMKEHMMDKERAMRMGDSYYPPEMQANVTVTVTVPTEKSKLLLLI